MKTKNIFSLSLIALTFLLTIGSFGLSTNAHAQTGSPSCTVLTSNLRIGQYDGINVVVLQTFLNAQGYLNHVPTGYFGSLTYAAVVNFQASQGLPNTGFVGPLTRAQIQALSCSNSIPPPTQNSVSIFSINPATGPVGTTVSLTGRWFTGDNTIYFGGVAIAHVASSGGVAIACTNDPSCVSGIRQTITFTIPDSISPYCAPNMMCAMYMRLVTPGIYPIYVTNSNGTSNTVNFVVTGSSVGSTVSITGIDAPNSLPIGVQGTWVVHVATNQSTNLHYSVVWGDEAGGTSSIMAPVPSSTSSLSSFTHTYVRTGNYMPTFTVTDDFGHSATTSATILVTPQY